jgi:Spy/CpxP family protein refolding chaperone
MNSPWSIIQRAILIAVMLAITLPSRATAQPRMASPEERAKQLKELLSLSDEQAAKVQKISKELEEEMTAKRGELTGNREAMRNASIEIVQKTDDKIKAILTDEQKEKYEELDITSGATARPGVPSPEERANQFKKQLSLSDEQTAKAQKIFKERREEMMARGTEAMGDRKAIRNSFTEIAQKSNDKIKAILTDEQKEKYEELEKERKKMIEQQMRNRPM